MANRFWVAGTGNWNDDTNHWATSSGGVPGAGNLPTAADNAIFDALSNTTAYTVTINVAAVCLDLNFSAAPAVSGTITWAGSSSMAISGNLTCLTGMTRTYIGVTTFKDTAGGKTITMNAVVLASNVTFDGVGGGWTLQDAFNIGTGTITVTNGALDTNGKTVTAATLSSSNSNVRTLTLGASAVNLSGGGTSWNTTTTTNLTFNANTSTITCSGANPTFQAGGLTYNNVVLSGSGVAVMGGTGSTFANLTRTGTAVKTDGINFSGNNTITGTLTLTGNLAINRLLVQSDVLATTRTLTAAAVSLTNVDFMDITGAGAASPFTGTSLGDGGGNSGITFTTPVTRFWVGNGGSWSSTTKWSTTSGGGSGASVPLMQDTATFDANSTPGGGVVTQDMPRATTMDFTNVTNTPGVTMSITSSIYGSLNLTGVGTFTHSNRTTFIGRAPYTLTSNGKTFSAAISLTAPTGTLTLQDDLNAGTSGLSILNAGTFDANNKNFTGFGFDSTTTTNTRTLTMGSGTWTCTGAGTQVWQLNATNLTFTANTATIKFTDATASNKTFIGGSFTYNILWFNVGASTGINIIQDTNTFNEFRDDGTAAHTIRFPNVTTTVTRFRVYGSSGNLVTLQRTGGAGTWTLSCAKGPIICDFLSISNSTASGGAVFYAGAQSTNGGGNTGWKFHGPARSAGGAATNISHY